MGSVMGDLTPRHGLLDQFLREARPYQKGSPPDRIGAERIEAGADEEIRQCPLVAVHRPLHPFERRVHLPEDAVDATDVIWGAVVSQEFV